MTSSILTHARYAPGEVLGRGAQALVLRVTDRESPNRTLVAKVWQTGVFHPELLAGEFALLMRLHLPGLVRAHDFGRDSVTGFPFLVEDFVDGPDAAEWVAQASSERERVERLERILTEAAKTLCLLHDAGFLHGDLKPAHVRIVSGSDEVTLLDLGAAVSRARNQDVVAISRGYTAPELLAGARPSAASDLYALGALAFAIATRRSPSEESEPVRRFAPWLPPSLGDVIDRLWAKHPADRFQNGRELLRALGAGRTTLRFARAAGGSSSPRERQISDLCQPRQGVRYVTGVPGAGKSHVIEEVVTRALLSGRDARLVRFPSSDAELVLRLGAWLRGADEARPFVTRGTDPLLVALDDLEHGPADIPSAVEAFRCRPHATRGIDLLVAANTAPAGASFVELAALDADGVRTLLRELDVGESRATELTRASNGNPGFVVAALGHVPLTRESALERAKRLNPAARRLLGAISILGGRMHGAVGQALVGDDANRAFAELAEASLVLRRSDAWVSSLPSLAQELAEGLSDFELVDALADVLLDERVGATASVLLALAEAPQPPSKREEVLRRAAEQARATGLRSEETRALFALAADPKERSVELLTSLDRLTRGGGSAGLHPEIVTWLGEARAPELEVLALRRRSEQLARAGESEEAARIAREAVGAAERKGDPAQIALALATSGSVALYRSDWTLADASLSRAFATLATGAVSDAEETARLYHNRGVVALFRGRLEESRDAFERSIEVKRALGDRAGLWACLLNLGLSLAQLGRHDDATRALDEAMELCRALGQMTGLAWCLAALADVAVRRGDAGAAERWVAEAEHLGTSLPESVKADLALLRAEVALLEGAGARALEHVATISESVREGDPLIRVRALVAEARAHLCTLPADRRRAARLAVQGIRIAREAGLPEPESRALEVLAHARGSRRVPLVAPTRARRYADDLMGDSGETSKLWGLLSELARGADRSEAALGLARFTLEESGAERAFVIVAADDGKVLDAWGVDLDGLPIADATRRVDEATVSAATKNGVSHQPSLDTRGGRGSRIVLLAPERNGPGRAGIVLEHRFKSGCFDVLDSERAARWAVFAGVVTRIGENASVRATPLATAHVLSTPSIRTSDSFAEPSTVLPLRGRRRVFPGIVGESAALDRALSRLDAAVDSDLPVLITGETGVGKELFARALHENGSRARGPFVAINCGAVPDSLFEAELFGHARGSFTGADRARAGLIARAEGGTLLLDEIGELPPLRQATLLRALATRSYRPVGSDEDKPFDVRIVAATNRALEGEVAAGRFRRDLLYRLNVLEIQVPALRDRPEDVLGIARHVLGPDAELSREASQALESYDWPGNVRELEHQMQRVASMGVQLIELEHLSREVRGALRRTGVKGLSRSRAPAGTPEAEREAVIAALDAAAGNITHAARRLSMTRQGLKKKMVRLGLREAGGQK